MSNELKEFELKMIYSKGKFSLPNLKIQSYRDEFYTQAQDLESELFYDFRKKYNFKPYRINESTPEEVDKIKQFFQNYKDTFYFLFIKNEYVGHLLMCNNFIQSICIHKNFQQQGYGTLLTKYAINEAIEKGYKIIELIVFKDNLNAIAMYRKIGFELENESHYTSI